LSQTFHMNFKYILDFFSKIYSMNVDCKKITWTCNQLCIYYKNIIMKMHNKSSPWIIAHYWKMVVEKKTIWYVIKIICKMLPIFYSKDWWQKCTSKMDDDHWYQLSIFTLAWLTSYVEQYLKLNNWIFCK
jgi:hypothetical protein